MKRIYKIATYVIATLGFLFVSTSCGKEKIVATKLEMSENANNEFKIGEFNYSDYEIIVTYSDNSTKTVVLDETMISNQDYLKTFVEGTKAITISYANISFDYEINVKRYSYDDDIYFPTGVDVSYDGDYHTIEVEGNIPEGTRIIYPNGNSFKNAGRYPISATLVNDLYVTKTINGEFTIKKSVYDISKLEFKDREFTYDGTEKMIEVKNAPKDLNITYSIGQASTNKAILAGEYTVIAHIDAGANYDAVDDLTAKMTIKKGTYDMTNYKFTNKTVTYNGEVQNLYITNENLLPTGVTVSYENNGNINAGTYEVIAKFISNNINYEPIEDKKATITIKKASYTLTGIYLDSDSVAYDGKPHYLYYSGTLPQGVSFEGYVDNGQVNAGVYTVQAKFTYRDANNYEPITPVTGILEITKSDLTSITFADKTVEYSGLNYKLTCENVPAGVTVNYSIKGRTETSVKEPGTYVFNASFTYDEVAANNYNPIADMEATLFIQKKTLQTGYSSKTVEYDGNPHSLECNLTTSEKEFITVSYWIYNDKHEYVPFVSATEPGSYLIYAEFEIEDETKEAEFYSHYEELYSQCETLIIDKVRYTPVFTNKVLKYMNGITQSVEYDYSDLANHPKLDFDDIVYTNNQHSEKGVYRATAKFYLTAEAEKYYYDVAEQEFMYVIVTNPSVAEETVFPIFDSSTVVYDGEAHSISVSGVPEGIEVDLQNNSQVMPGTHLVTAIFTYEDPVIKHYYDLPKGQGTYYELAGEEDKVYCTVAFVIEKKLYNVKYTNNNRFAYDGNNKVIEVDPSETYISATFEYLEDERKIPGTYSVICKPKITNETFNQIYRVEDSVVEFEIVKADVMFSYTGLTVYYDGKEHYIKVIGLPDGITAISSGDGQIKPGIYPVEISFVKDNEVVSSAYYNDIESQLETLTILSNVVSTAGFINYVNEGDTKFVNQFTTLREFVGNWINLDGFRVDWSCDYFKGPSDEYSITDKARHGSSKNSSDFVFSESTINDDFVMVSIKLTLKEGYEIQDGSMGKTFSTLITLHVGQTIAIDISEFNQAYGENGSVDQNTSWVSLLRDNISDFDLITYTYTADYYIGNNMYSEEQGNVHGDSTLQDDFIFSLATWGNRTCNVSYTLEVPKGYSLFDGTRSYQKLEKTTKLLVNPLTEVDVNYLNDITNSSYKVVQYTRFSENITNVVDFNHLDVTWSIDDGSNQVIDNTTDYIIKNTDDFTCTITVKTKDNFTIRGSSLSEFTKTFTCNVESRPAVDFSDFITKMDETDKTIIQYFDYFTDIINDVVMPEDADFVITIYDVDGHVFAYEELGSFSVDNYVEGKKLKVDFEFYPSGERLIVDENSYASNYRKFTYEYDIQEALTFDQYLDALENTKTQYETDGITQFTNIQDIYGNIFADFANYDFIDCVYQIDYYNGVDLLLSEDYRNWNEDYIFNKTSIGGVSISDVVVYTYFELDKNGGYVFHTTGYLYSGFSSFSCQINKVFLLNDKVNSLTNKEYLTKAYKAIYLLDNYGVLTSSEVTLTHITIKDSLDAIVYDWDHSSTTWAYSYAFEKDGVYSIEYSYNTQKGYYYEKDGLGYTSFSYSIDVNVNPRDAIYATYEYATVNTYDKFTKITDIVNLYATSPDPKYNKEQFLGGIFSNYKEKDNKDFTEHLIVTNFKVEYLDSDNQIISTVSGYTNSSACLGVSCSKVYLYVTYAFDDDCMFVDSYGNILGDGLTCTRQFTIKINEDGYEQINTWQSNYFWTEYKIVLAGRPIGEYFYYGLEAYKDDLYTTYCSVAGVINNGLYVGYLKETDKVDAMYDYLYVCFRLTVVDSSKLYFSIASDGSPIRSYSFDYVETQIRTPILVDEAILEQAITDAKSVKVGKRIFTFTENSNLAYTYHIDQYSHETCQYAWRTTFYTNRSAYFSDKDTSNTPEEMYEITIIITVRDETKYLIVNDDVQLFGFTRYSIGPRSLIIYH